MKCCSADSPFALPWLRVPFISPSDQMNLGERERGRERGRELSGLPAALETAPCPQSHL